MLTPEEREKRFVTQPMTVAKDQTTSWAKLPSEGISFEAAVARIKAADEADGLRSDRGLTKLSAYVIGPGLNGEMSLAARDGGLTPVMLRDTAFKQLCAQVGAPPEYVRELPGRLQTLLLDHGLRSAEDANGRLMRLAAGEARAVLSDRYTALDNSLVIDVTGNALAKLGILDSARIVGLATGATTVMRMHLPTEIVSMPLPPIDGVPDNVTLAFDVGNGEIGNRAVSVIGALYRLVCKNGLRTVYSSDTHRLRHVGDPKRLTEAFIAAVPAAINTARGARQKLQASIDRFATDALGEIDGLRQFGLSALDSRDVARDVAAERRMALPEKHGEWTSASFGEPLSVYEIVNAMTHIAQSRGVDARLDMEDAAGRYLERRTR